MDNEVTEVVTEGGVIRAAWQVLEVDGAVLRLPLDVGPDGRIYLPPVAGATTVEWVE
jgi:hypothetical protein